MSSPEVHRLLAEAAARGAAPALEAGFGAAGLLDPRALTAAGPVLLVASERAVRNIPLAADLLAAGASHYGRTHPNPTTDDVIALSALIEQFRPRTIVAIGGGSTIDLAKAARLLCPDRLSIDAGLRGDTSSMRADPPEVIAVPTLAGTGAEVTPFATLYRNRRKVSLDAPAVRPERAVLDGSLVLSAPPEHSVPALLDALCHAVEAGWSRARTPESKRAAVVAREALVAHLSAPLAVRDVHQAQELLSATTLAGTAIAVSRTTAAHAFSYHLTAEYGIPHGFACAMSMSWVEKHLADRRPGICSPKVRAAAEAIRRVLARAEVDGLVESPRLSGGRLEAYIDAGLSTQTRLSGHPVRIDRDSARRFVMWDGFLTYPRGNAVASAHLLDSYA
ncbi:iron-containing alcohol dehydrogenase [Leifsonia shinshuensis]|nr:iron-containing alcohol dehydrogenase [Leifsonia shinshuensis]